MIKNLTACKELVEYIIKQLVDMPHEASVSVTSNNAVMVISITVHKQDRGKIIGRYGQTIKALRTLITSLITDEYKSVELDLV